LGELDFVQIMTVQAGFGGQSFQSGPLSKIAELRRARPDLLIEVDGGVSRDTIGECVTAGADVLVVGSAIFNGEDFAGTHTALKNEMKLARPPGAARRTAPSLGLEAKR
jgi:ribulose-phosphate 3-epimerase